MMIMTLHHTEIPCQLFSQKNKTGGDQVGGCMETGGGKKQATGFKPASLRLLSVASFQLDHACRGGVIYVFCA